MEARGSGQQPVETEQVQGWGSGGRNEEAESRVRAEGTNEWIEGWGVIEKTSKAGLAEGGWR